MCRVDARQAQSTDALPHLCADGKALEHASYATTATAVSTSRATHTARPTRAISIATIKRTAGRAVSAPVSSRNTPRTGLRLVRQPEAGQRHPGEADAELLE